MENDLQRQIDELTKKVDMLLNDQTRNVGASAQTFTRKVYFAGGVELGGGDVVLGGSGNTVGFYGSTGTTKQTAVNASAVGAAYSQAEVNDIVSKFNSLLNQLRAINLLG